MSDSAVIDFETIELGSWVKVLIPMGEFADPGDYLQLRQRSFDTVYTEMENGKLKRDLKGKLVSRKECKVYARNFEGVSKYFTNETALKAVVLVSDRDAEAWISLKKHQIQLDKFNIQMSSAIGLVSGKTYEEVAKKHGLLRKDIVNNWRRAVRDVWSLDIPQIRKIVGIHKYYVSLSNARQDPESWINAFNNCSYESAEKRRKVQKWKKYSNFKRGTESGSTNLTDSDIVDIRSARISGATYKMIAHRYSMSTTQISRICTRKAWKHIK